MNASNQLDSPIAKQTSSSSDIMAASPVHMSGKSEARIIGSAVAGISELALFHPVDTGMFIFSRSGLFLNIITCPITLSTRFWTRPYFWPVPHILPYCRGKTVAKRLMSTETKFIVLNSPSQTVTNLNHAIFKTSATEGFGGKVMSLFPGIGFGAAYKILQRVYKCKKVRRYTL